jgi:hypothetical protein
MRAALCLLLGAMTTVGVAWSLWLTGAGQSVTIQRARIEQGTYYWEAAELRDGMLTVRTAVYASMSPIGGAGDGPPRISMIGGELMKSAAERTAASPHLISESEWRELPLAHWSVRDGWGKLPREGIAGTHSFALGWPFRTVWGWRSIAGDAAGGLIDPYGRRPKPYLPIWRGFLLSTIAFAVPAWMLSLLPGGVARWRRRRRAARGGCAECGYDLAGLAVGDGARTCPECGAPSRCQAPA